MIQLFVAAAAVAAAAQPVDDHRLSLTIYNSNLALVQEERPIDVPAGRTKLEFADVSAGILPDTVTLSSKGVSIVEQNFDYDLLTPAKMMEKAVGQQVQIVRTNPGNGQQVTETATVLSVNNGVVLKVGDHIEVLRDDGVPTRVIFPKVPDNLRSKPTLTMTVDVEGAGPRPATLSYLTTGLYWKADYVALFDETAGRLDLQGWVTLKNDSGTSFQNATAQLVAGDINLRHNEDDNNWRYRSQPPVNPERSGAQSGAPEWADYKIYPLPDRTTIADNQTKQIGFLNATRVTAAKAYLARISDFESMKAPQHVGVVVKFSNSRESGLASPLPAGTVRVYVRDAKGAPQFVGEDAIEHTAQGSDVSVKTGESFDVSVLATDLNAKKTGHNGTVHSMTYEVANARSEPVVVELRQEGLRRSGKVEQESLSSHRTDAQTVAWMVAVPAGGSTTVTATINAGW